MTRDGLLERGASRSRAAVVVLDLAMVKSSDVCCATGGS
jgi:hypothetical protein